MLSVWRVRSGVASGNDTGDLRCYKISFQRPDRTYAHTKVRISSMCIKRRGPRRHRSYNTSIRNKATKTALVILAKVIAKRRRPAHLRHSN